MTTQSFEMQDLNNKKKSISQIVKQPLELPTAGPQRIVYVPIGAGKEIESSIKQSFQYVADRLNGVFKWRELECFDTYSKAFQWVRSNQWNVRHIIVEVSVPESNVSQTLTSENNLTIKKGTSIAAVDIKKFSAAWMIKQWWIFNQFDKSQFTAGLILNQSVEAASKEAVELLKSICNSDKFKNQADWRFIQLKRQVDQIKDKFSNNLEKIIKWSGNPGQPPTNFNSHKNSLEVSSLLQRIGNLCVRQDTNKVDQILDLLGFYQNTCLHLNGDSDLLTQSQVASSQPM